MASQATIITPWPPPPSTLSIRRRGGMPQRRRPARRRAGVDTTPGRPAVASVVAGVVARVVAAIPHARLPPSCSAGGAVWAASLAAACLDSGCRRGSSTLLALPDQTGTTVRALCTTEPRRHHRGVAGRRLPTTECGWPLSGRTCTWQGENKTDVANRQQVTHQEFGNHLLLGDLRVLQSQQYLRGDGTAVLLSLARAPY